MMRHFGGVWQDLCDLCWERKGWPLPGFGTSKGSSTTLGIKGKAWTRASQILPLYEHLYSGLAAGHSRKEVREKPLGCGVIAVGKIHVQSAAEASCSLVR